jgi:hypothetical protein
MAEPDDVQQHFKVLSVICGAIASGVVIFAGVVWYLLTSGRMVAEGTGIPANLGSILSLTALFLLVLAHFLPRFLAVPREAHRDAILATHKRNTVVAMALREGAAFLALVGALLSGQMMPGMAVALLAVLTILLGWPRKAQIEEQLRRSAVR